MKQSICRDVCRIRMGGHGGEGADSGARFLREPSRHPPGISAGAGGTHTGGKSRKRNGVLAAALLVMMFMGTGMARAAMVNPDIGYTNAFSSLPLAADFSQTSLAGTVDDVTGVVSMDAAVAVLSAGGITAGLISEVADPPSYRMNPMWTSGGSGYMVTRPTSNKGGAILGTFVNNTGTNATIVHIQYDYRAVLPVSEQAGVRVYYSLSGAAGSWINVPALSPGTTSYESLTPFVADLNLMWNHGATLYLLWMDDNGLGSPDTACEYDNFWFLDVFSGIGTEAWLN